MAEQTRTEGERVAHLEGQIAHLATKADIGLVDAKIERLRTELKSDNAKLDAKIEGVSAELRTIKWIIGIAIPAAIAITGIAVGAVVQILNSLP